MTPAAAQSGSTSAATTDEGVEGTREGSSPGGRAQRRDTQRAAIESAALRLLDEGGPEVVTTRAVGAAAGVQPMSIYRLFGDMDGLVASAAARCVADYVEAKRSRKRRDDPVDDLRAGWDLHVDFGLSHPYVYAELYGRHVPGRPSPAVEDAAAVLRGLVRRVAEAGRLTRDVETAAQMIHAAGCGVTISLMAVPPHQRDLSVSGSVREAVLAAVTVPAERAAGTAVPGPADGPLPDEVRRHAVSLDAALAGHGGRSPFTDAERSLLQEWLHRLA